MLFELIDTSCTKKLSALMIKFIFCKFNYSISIFGRAKEKYIRHGIKDASE